MIFENKRNGVETPKIRDKFSSLTPDEKFNPSPVLKNEHSNMINASKVF